MKTKSEKRKEPAIPHDLEFALQTIIEHKGNMNHWRAQRLKELQELILSSDDIDKVLEANRSENSRWVSKHIRLRNVLIAAESSGWPDRAVTEMLALGARPMGD